MNNTTNLFFRFFVLITCLATMDKSFSAPVMSVTGGLRILKHNDASMGLKGNYFFNLTIRVANERSLPNIKNLFDNYLLNGELQKKIGSLNGVSIKKYTINFDASNSQKYKIDNRTVKNGMSQKFQSNCFITQRPIDTAIDTGREQIQHTCQAYGVETLFSTQPTQSINCMLIQNKKFIECQFQGSGTPQEQSYAFGLIKRDAVQLAIGGTTELIKTFCGIMLYASSNTYTIGEIKKVSGPTDNALLNNGRDIFDEMTQQMQNAAYPQVFIKY